MAGSECNECPRRADSPGASASRSPSHPPRLQTTLDPRGGADGDGGLVRRRRVEFRVWGSTDSRTVLQSAGELACRAFVSANVPLAFYLLRRRPPFVRPVHTRHDAYNVPPSWGRRRDSSIALASQEFREMKPRDGPS